MPDVVTGITAGVSLFSAKAGRDAAKSAGSAQDAAVQLEAERDRYNMDIVEQTNELALEDRADIIDRRGRERRLYDPLQEGIISRAMEGPDYEGAISRSDADVTQAYGLARDQERRRQSRYGINPASGVATAESRRFDNAEALSKVQGRSQARLGEDTKDWARRIAAWGTGNISNVTPTTNLAQLGRPGAAGALQSQSNTYAQNASGAFQFAGSMFADAMDSYKNSSSPSAGLPNRRPHSSYFQDNGDPVN